MRIGLFDSGLGGVNVLSSLIKKFPNNEYIYFGDTKNIPYGNKSKEELLKLANDAITFLISKNVDIIIIACGTISSNCYQELKNKYKIPIYDIISPTINYLKDSNFQNIGIIGTIKTIDSGIFNIKNKNIISKKTPNFVPIIENNEIMNKKNEIIQELKDLKNIDILVLGCTHYPLLKEIIENDLKIKTLDMGECLANTIKLPNDKNKSYELYFSKIDEELLNNINNILHAEFKIYLK